MMPMMTKLHNNKSRFSREEEQGFFSDGIHGRERKSPFTFKNRDFAGKYNSQLMRCFFVHSPYQSIGLLSQKVRPGLWRTGLSVTITIKILIDQAWNGALTFDCNKLLGVSNNIENLNRKFRISCSAVQFQF
jgi:hypothetical protein